jgi:hypothetical protein
MHAAPDTAGAARYELRFTGLFHASPDFAFPCDAHGNVDFELLSEAARANYLRVRAKVGREFLGPLTCRIRFPED